MFDDICQAERSGAAANKEFAELYRAERNKTVKRKA